MKTCKRCEETLPIDSFSRNESMKDGRLSFCKKCRHSKADQLKWNIKKYGMSLIDYRLMQWAQGDVCRICGKPETDTNNGVVKRLAVDHCHETGEVRGLLCARCNRAIGLMDDDASRLLSAVEYLGIQV